MSNVVFDQEGELNTKIDTEEELVNHIRQVIIPEALENLKSSKKEPVYVCVNKGERKFYLKVIRQIVKFDRIPTSIEDVLKVVEEETLEE